MPTHPRWNARYAHDELAQMLRHQEWLLHRILERITTMSAELDRLTTEVGETRTVDVHVRRLREKIPLLTTALSTVKQFGYKLDDPPPQP